MEARSLTAVRERLVRVGRDGATVPLFCETQMHKLQLTNRGYLKARRS